MTNQPRKPRSASRERAYHLARQEQNYIAKLVQLREQQGITLEELAQRLGWAVEALERFESQDKSPTISETCTYAQGIGALVRLDAWMDTNYEETT